MKFRLILLATSLLFGISSCNDVKDQEEGTEVKIEKTYEERVQEIVGQIRSNPQWLADVEKKSKEKNIPLDSMILVDARWLVDEQDGKHSAANTATQPADNQAFEEKVSAMEQKIRNDKAWLESITQKAKERNLTVDSMIKMDARFIVTEQEKSQQ
jgi:hypothetical protein